MNSSTFDAIFRHAGALSRRGSLRLLGGAALAGALASPAPTGAKRRGRKSNDRCQRQKGQCLAFVEDRCDGEMDPAGCKALFSPCCEDFALCNAGAGLDCFFRQEV